MPDENESVTISMNATLHLFEAVLAGHKAVLQYQLQGRSIALIHTEVPHELEGRGVGSALARAGLNYAREHNLSVLPYCPFVEQYIRRHPEELALVEPAYRKEWFPG